MSSTQIEPVPGNHLVVVKSGAVIVVAHRDGSRLTESSPASVVGAALVGLIDEAIASDGEDFGEAFTRLADRWSTTQGDDVEFAGIAPSSGGFSIYLRGSVGVMFEHPHGSEDLLGLKGAPFVDLISLSSGKAALFVIEAERAPIIPSEAGIGSMVEGVVQGAGAVIWLTADPQAEPESVDATTEPPTTAVVPSVELRPPKIYDSFRPGDVPPPMRPPLPPIRRAPTPSPPPLVPPRGTPPRPEKSVARAPTGQRPAAGDRMVRGVLCSDGHLNDPQAAFCRVCGRRIDHTKAFVEGERPALGVLVLDDGAAIVLHGDCVFGREPETSDAARRGSTPIRLADRSGRLSRAHAEVRLVDWDVVVVDLGSTNGTLVRLPSEPQPRRLAPGTAVTLAPGAEVTLGGRVLTFDSASARI